MFAEIKADLGVENKCVWGLSASLQKKNEMVIILMFLSLLPSQLLQLYHIISPGI